MGYSVLIVDDESAILNGIRDTVAWGELGIGHVRTASSGEDALEEFRREPPDILLTDIRMKGMNGLQLIREVKRLGSRARYIVLSAYDDFSYAKEAMQMSIDNYILKPINWNELRDTLKNSLLKIEQEQMNGLDADTMDMLRTNTLYKWCRESLDEYQFHLRADLFSISLERKLYLVGLVPGKGDICAGKRRQLADGLPDLELFETFDRDACVILGADSQEELFGRIDLLEGRLNLLLGGGFRFLFGKIVSGYKQLGTSYATLFVVQSTMGFTPGIRRVMFDDIMKKRTDSRIALDPQLAEEFAALRRAVLAMEPEKADETAHRISGKLSALGMNPMDAFNCCVGVILELRGIADEMNLDIRERYFDISEMIRKIQALDGGPQIDAFLREEARQVITSLELSKNAYPPIISRVIEYTRKHYSEEITLRFLAEKFNVNANYLGTLFMEHVGQAFSEYLNRCRMVEAKNLLLSSDLKVNAIASSLGYSNPSYFYILFKKMFGISPNEFRSAGRQEGPGG